MNIHPLQQAAVRLADSLNAGVVAAALLEYNAPCPHCRYARDAAAFEDALFQYRLWRIRYARLYGGCMNDAKASWGGIETVYVRMMQANDKLTYLWPCPECVRLHNPTRRKKSRYGDRRRNRKHGR